jgi:hypothetical protein
MSVRVLLIALLVLVPSVSRGCAGGDKYGALSGVAFAVEHLQPPPAEPPAAEQPPPESPPVPLPPPVVDWTTIAWRTIIAALINGALVMVAVQLIKVYMPYFKVRIPWALPLIAMVAGPLIAWFQGFLADLLGQPIDLAPILGPYTEEVIGVAAGAFAVTVHQLKQQSETPEQRLAAIQKRIAELEKMRLGR